MLVHVNPMAAEPIGHSGPPTFWAQWASTVARPTTFLRQNWLFFHFIL